MIFILELVIFVNLINVKKSEIYSKMLFLKKKKEKEKIMKKIRKII
jgi:hypothetical protein